MGESMMGDAPNKRVPEEHDYDLSIVVPTRNESGNIRPLLERIASALPNVRLEVIFVDDSTDDTAAVIQQQQQQTAYDFPISLIHRPEEQRNGLSGAVVEGLKTASGGWVCVMDGDLQHPPEEIRHLLDQAERTGADILVASRRADAMGPEGLSKARAATSQALTILARGVFPRVLKNVSDPLTGFFLLRRTAVNLEGLRPDGFKILMEILVRHPELHVSEIEFTFADRNKGQSKADVQEGLRFFRHLATLRLTVNQHLVRFLGLLAAAAALNLVVLFGLIQLAGLPEVQAVVIAGLVTVLFVSVGELWVYSDRNKHRRSQRWLIFLLSGILLLFVVYLPVLGLMMWVGLPFTLAWLPAMVAVGFVYYLLSEHWIWTRGLTMQGRRTYFYDLHGILTIASEAPLADMSWFAQEQAPEQVDLNIRIDRHGTPTRVPGGISFNEHLGRFGFGLTLVPGKYTEIIVSPLLGNSPSFLYANIVEPVLHWMLLQRGYSLAYAAAVADETEPADSARVTLLTGETQMAFGISQLCRQHNLDFMADDRIIVGRRADVLAFPKPVSVNQEMMQDATAAAQASAPLILQKMLYSVPVRRMGLFLSRNRLPAATANTYLQRILPQPKHTINLLLPTVEIRSTGVLERVVLLNPDVKDSGPNDIDAAIASMITGNAPASGFQPRPLIMEQLSHWQGTDWAAVEESVLREALSTVIVVRSPEQGDQWWEESYIYGLS